MNGGHAVAAGADAVAVPIVVVQIVVDGVLMMMLVWWCRSSDGGGVVRRVMMAVAIVRRRIVVIHNVPDGELRRTGHNGIGGGEIIVALVIVANGMMMCADISGTFISVRYGMRFFV